MRKRPLDLPDVVVFEPEIHSDQRGDFLEWMRADDLVAATGRRLRLEQANLSISKRGVLRGIHAASVPPGQAKWVTAVSGEILDLVVDLRVGSPTFGSHAMVRLDDVSRNAVFIPEGLGHAFVALSETATLCYLVNSGYDPAGEFTISVFDPALELELPFSSDDAVLSDRDRDAPTLHEAHESGILPGWDACRAAYEAAR